MEVHTQGNTPKYYKSCYCTRADNDCSKCRQSTYLPPLNTGREYDFNQLPQPKVQVGWKCPVCGKGNSPFATKCGHC